MSNATSRVQIEVPTKLKISFKEQAKQYGMDLSNAMRFVMQQFSVGAIVPTIQVNTDPSVSPKKANEYKQIAQSIRSDKEELIGPFDSTDGLMESLED